MCTLLLNALMFLERVVGCEITSLVPQDQLGRCLQPQTWSKSILLVFVGWLSIIVDQQCIFHFISISSLIIHTHANRANIFRSFSSLSWLWTHAQRASMLYFANVFLIFFFILAALVGQTAERIFTKLSHVVDIRWYLRTY